MLASTRGMIHLWLKQNTFSGIFSFDQKRGQATSIWSKQRLSDKYSIEPGQVTQDKAYWLLSWQVDNGGEFLGSHRKIALDNLRNHNRDNFKRKKRTLRTYWTESKKVKADIDGARWKRKSFHRLYNCTALHPQVFHLSLKVPISIEQYWWKLWQVVTCRIWLYYGMLGYIVEQSLTSHVAAFEEDYYTSFMYLSSML